MFNGDKMRGLMAEKRLTQGDIAKIIGISQVAMSHKMNGVSPWMLDEIQMLVPLFGIEGIIDVFLR